MSRSQAKRRVAFIGLAAVLLVLTGVSVVGTVTTRHAATSARTASSLAEAYHRAHEAVSLEVIAEQQYRLEPERHARVEHADAAGELETALEDIEARGGANDRVLTARTRTLHRQYLTAMEALFLAVDRADPVEIRRVDQDEVDPAEGQIKTLLHDAEDAQDTAARAAGARLDRVEQLVFVATLSSFAVGLGMIVVFTLVATGYQRRLVRQAQQDELTGLPNRSVFIARTACAPMKATARRTAAGGMRPGSGSRAAVIVVFGNTTSRDAAASRRSCSSSSGGRFASGTASWRVRCVTVATQRRSRGRGGAGGAAPHGAPDRVPPPHPRHISIVDAGAV
ncbi:hypothetical protein ACPPVO_17770 [Dactylosporangium sp. McL0621]|uniref:hypothetical protein n=1 Tax=Dactylosporangium sp. McL0621 TaxID=3415678 RepID=UPI003CEE6678